MFKIDDNVPVGADGRGRPGRYPLSDLHPGQSFFVPGAAAVSARRAALQFAKRHGRLITTRAVTENGVQGVRVWRVS